MQIPTKIQHGEKVIGTVFEKINGIIDYLNASKLRKSSGIDVRETPSGTVLELVQKSASAPQAQQSPAVASGLVATVSGGTATVAISGSTALVIEPGANIQISGGTNGELIISATGGGGSTGFPDYFGKIVNQGDVDLSGTTYSYPYPVWLIGTIGAVPNSTSMYMRCGLDLWLGASPNSERVGLVNISGEFSYDSYASRSGTFVSVLIPANVPFYFLTTDDTSYYVNDLAIYPCL